MTRPRCTLELDRERGHWDNVAEWGVVQQNGFLLLSWFLSLPDALTFGRVILLPPLVQLRLHSL
jgi:hypothetical protein